MFCVSSRRCRIVAGERLKKDFESATPGLQCSPPDDPERAGLEVDGVGTPRQPVPETRKFRLEEIVVCSRCRIAGASPIAPPSTIIEELGLGFINYSLVPYLTTYPNSGSTPDWYEKRQGVFIATRTPGVTARGYEVPFEAYATGINWEFIPMTGDRRYEPRPVGCSSHPMNMTTKPSDGSKAGKPEGITPRRKRLDVPLSLKSVSDSGEFEGYGSVWL